MWSYEVSGNSLPKHLLTLPYVPVSPPSPFPFPPHTFHFKAQLKPRDSSVEVRSDWEVKEEMDFPRLMKMRYMEVEDPTDM